MMKIPCFVISVLLALFFVVGAQIPTQSPSPVPTQSSSQNPSGLSFYENDINVLRYALTLENLEATYWKYVFSKFTYQDFLKAGLSLETYTYLRLIGHHEEAHAQALTFTLNTLQYGSAVPPCEYALPALNSPLDVVRYGALFEAIGVRAYDGAANLLSMKSLLASSASIASVEARHSAYLNTVLGRNPFPDAFDPYDLPPVIAANVSALFVSCPYELDLPTLLTYTVSNVSTAPLPLLYVDGLATRDVPVNVATLSANDRTTLLFAYALEKFESTFYSTFLNKFSVLDFLAAGYSLEDYTYIGYINQHEYAHTLTLAEVLSNQTYPDCAYNFTAIQTVTDFFYYATLFENVGAAAYDGAITSFSNPSYILAAATIATVEARHSAWLYEKQGQVPFPKAFNTAFTPSMVATMIAPFFSTCPFTIELPTVLTYIPPNIYPAPFPPAAPVRKYQNNAGPYYQPGQSSTPWANPTAAPTSSPTPNTVNINVGDALNY